MAAPDMEVLQRELESHERLYSDFAREADHLLLRIPALRRLGSNFELIAQLPGPHPVR